MLPHKRIKAEHQQRATKEGERFRLECVDAFVETGFRVVHTCVRVQQCGIELDILAANRHDIFFPSECKGGLGRGDHAPGFQSSDNVKKAIGSATSLAHSPPWIDEVATPLLIFTTALAKPPTKLFDQFAILPTDHILDVVDPRDSKALKMLANMTYFQLQAYLHDMPVLAFRLFDNRYWAINGTATEYFAQLNRKPMLNLQTQMALDGAT